MDLDIALRTIHEWSAAEADLGRDYWAAVSRLLEDADRLKVRVVELQAQVDRLERSEKELRRKLRLARQSQAVQKGGKNAPRVP